MQNIDFYLEVNNLQPFLSQQFNRFCQSRENQSLLYRVYTKETLIEFWGTMVNVTTVSVFNI